MRSKPNLRFMKDEEGIERIISIQKLIGYELQDKEKDKELNSLLETSFSGAERGIMFDERFALHQVIVFPTHEDCTAFALAYGDKFLS